MFEVRNLATIEGQNRVERPTNNIVELTSTPFFCVLTEFLPQRAWIYENNIYQPRELGQEKDGRYVVARGLNI